MSEEEGGRKGAKEAEKGGFQRSGNGVKLTNFTSEVRSPPIPPSPPSLPPSLDTEGAFMAERAAEVGQALIDHLQRILASNQSKQQQQGGREGGAVLQQLQQQAEDVEGLTLETVLGNVWVFRCLNDAELLQTLQHLPAFLEREPEVDGEGGREGGREG